MKIVGMDVGSTTVKAMIVENDEILWRDYQRHNTRQAEKVQSRTAMGTASRFSRRGDAWGLLNEQKATTGRDKAGVAFCVDEAQSSGADAPRQAQ